MGNLEPQANPSGPPVTRRALRAGVLRGRLLAPHGPLAALDVVDRASSTNTELTQAARRDPTIAAPAVLMAEFQDAGRGRQGRTWVAPPRAALLGSALIRPTNTTGMSWLPLLSGLAVVRAVRGITGVQAQVKWPNDIVVPLPGAPNLPGWGNMRKLGGILSEMVPGGAVPAAVVIGVGLNVWQQPDELPEPTATSLAIAAGQDQAHLLDREHLLIAIVGSFVDVLAQWSGTGMAELAAECAAQCHTLGHHVAVALPDGTRLAGMATRLADDGALVIEAGGREHVVRSGDVLRLG